MRTSPGYFAFPEGIDVIGVIISAEAADRLMDVPHDALTNQTFDAEGRGGRHLQRGLAVAGCCSGSSLAYQAASSAARDS